MDFPIPVKTERKQKKKDKYVDLARELKKKNLSNMKVTVIPIVNGTLGTVSKGFLHWTGGLGNK